MKKLISFDEVSKKIAHKTILNKISFDLYEGQILGLLGHNGAGKSTIINLLLGADNYTGIINVMGKTPYKDRQIIMQDLAYLSDAESLPKWMKVRDIIKYMKGVHPKFSEENAVSYLNKTDINLTTKIAELSKGMTMQLHLSLIMATNCKILILDEPTLGLDLMYRHEFYHLVQEWFNESGRSILITSHEINELENFITDVVFIKNGSVTKRSSLKNIISEYFKCKVEVSHFEKLKKFNPYILESNNRENIILIKKEFLDEVVSIETIIPNISEIFLAHQKGA